MPVNRLAHDGQWWSARYQTKPYIRPLEPINPGT